MGALMMTRDSNNVKDALSEFGVVRECVSCSQGLMIPSTKNFRKEYKGAVLVIENVPIFKCQNDECREVTYSTGSLLKAIRFAKKCFDLNGKSNFDFNELI
jgi:YgiT-type zinc finger domain-containing protein